MFVCKVSQVLNVFIISNLFFLSVFINITCLQTSI
nr:MAG TPA: hypothetical protein [Caudoviricetes sp.]